MTTSEANNLNEEPIFNPFFKIDLDDEEMVFDSYLAFQFTTKRDIAAGHPAGITVSANRLSHGADVHITLTQAQAFRDALTRALREAGAE